MKRMKRGGGVIERENEGKRERYQRREKRRE